MLYAAMCFWLLVAVLAAWGVHQLWSGLVKPRTVNSILLPGTLVAQLGHVAGLLVTGATVTNTTLYKDDESGEPEMTQDPKPRIPVFGPIIIGMLPLVSCAVAIFLVTRYLGGNMVAEATGKTVAATLPMTLAGFWELLRDQITLMESSLGAALAADWGQWQVWLFVYLVVCLTVRMAPFPGTLRGSLGAAIVLGLLAALAASLLQSSATVLESLWVVLTLSVGTLMVLLMGSLMIRGGVGLFKLLASNR
jgi:hypothetical protein